MFSKIRDIINVRHNLNELRLRRADQMNQVMCDLSTYFMEWLAKPQAKSSAAPVVFGIMVEHTMRGVGECLREIGGGLKAAADVQGELGRVRIEQLLAVVRRDASAEKGN